MDWLFPSVVATLTSTFVLALVYLYLYMQDHERSLGIWTLSWFIYALRFVWMLLLVLLGDSQFLLLANQLSTLASALLLLWGSYVWTGRHMRGYWFWLALICALWITVTMFLQISFLWLTLPPFIFIGLIYIGVGVVFLRYAEVQGLGKSVTSVAFIIWGLHKMDYPFLRPVVWIAPWGYLLGAVLALLVAIGVILMHIERARDALRTSEARYRLLVENQNDLIVKFTPEGHFSFVSPRYCEVFGKSEEELLDKDFVPLIHEDDRAQVEASLQKLYHPPHTCYHEERALTAQGWRWLAWSDRAILDDAGEIQEFIGIGRDITERKQATLALQEAHTQLTEVLGSISDGFFALDAELAITYFNLAAEQLLGREREDVLGRHLFKAFPEAKGSIFEEKYTFAFKEQQLLTFETYFDVAPYANWYAVRVYPYPEGISVYFQVTTEQRRVEQERDRFFNLSMDMFCIAGFDGYFKQLNPAWEKILGWSAQELLAKPWLEFVHPEDRPSTQVASAVLFQGDIIRTFENRYLCQDGSYRWLSWNSISVPEEGKIFAVARDITEQKEAEHERERLLAEIQGQMQRINQILQAVPEGVLLLDENCRVILANPLGERDLEALTGAGVGDVLAYLGGRPLPELLTSPPKGLWHELVEEGRNFQVIARALEVGPISDAWLLVIRDMTQQYEMERRMHLQERLAIVGQLAAGIAHDFNNIMSTIVLYAQMSAQTEGLPPSVQGRLSTIRDQALHATRLIQQILDFSRRGVVERQPLDLLPLLKEQVRILERTLPENIKITLSYDQDAYTISGDPTHMQQVFMNLALNARDAISGAGELKFTLLQVHFKRRRDVPFPEMETGDWIEVCISDTGSGISPDVLPHIFDPFFTTKAANGGTGLGLAQVQGIITTHQGFIDVETQVGHGSTFILYLPAWVSPQDEISSAEQAGVLQGQREHILVVEDNPATREALIDSLETLNYVVSVAKDGQEALMQLDQHMGTFDLILSDVVMPRMGGIALLHALRDRDIDIPVVLLTGHPLESELEDLRAQGFSAWLVDWVLKPLSFEQLSVVVARALGKL